MNKEGERTKGRQGLWRAGQVDQWRAGSGNGPLKRGSLLTLVIGAAWAWYSLNSFCRVSGYFMARMVPTEVPTNIMRPECEMMMAV